jgi:Fur family transcriptional regulator, ferric uptake regulator
MKQETLRRMPPIKWRRRTLGRQEILRAVDEMQGHFDAHMLHVLLKSKGLKISRASVYRTIAILVETGIINEVVKTEKHAHYEKVAENRHHDHLICLRCGKTIEFFSPTLEMLQDEICQRERFRSIRHSLEIMGCCQECEEKA